MREQREGGRKKEGRKGMMGERGRQGGIKEEKVWND